jgi:hypothetical protein
VYRAARLRGVEAEAAIDRARARAAADPFLAECLAQSGAGSFDPELDAA